MNQERVYSPRDEHFVAPHILRQYLDRHQIDSPYETARPDSVEEIGQGHYNRNKLGLKNEKNALQEEKEAKLKEEMKKAGTIDRKQKIKAFKSMIGFIVVNFGMFIIVFIYLFLGALLFQMVEQNNEITSCNKQLPYR
jgi:hypothetical protein